MGNKERITKKVTSKSKNKSGTLEGEFWVWPDGKKTHMHHIGMAVRQQKGLPQGFYVEAEKVMKDNPNLALLVNKAKHLKLKDNIVEP